MGYRKDMNVKGSALTSAQIAQAERLLGTAPFAYMAMVEPGGPYVLPLNFVYVSEGLIGPEATSAGDAPPVGKPLAPASGGLDGRIYFHTGEGRKTAALATDPRVCLAVTGGVIFEQGDTPCADGFAYRSLLIWGRARRLMEEDRRRLALRAIVTKYDPGAVDTPLDEADLGQTLVFEVTIEAASYKERPRPGA
jgi:nitroimidazol reductase NimA-like FMN-containing flavoprotein (pyridoxamine 5'-phosphate oxidase superfamily)